ncbi:MAG: hypothetical protein JXO44_02950 [Clostridia bacterium]|nr:hypothetical protein [Clostridia bacterium]
MKVFFLWRQVILTKAWALCHDRKGEFGVGSILSIAVALIVSAFVLVPGMRTLADTIIKGMGTWWANTISGNIFPTT